MMVLDVNLLLYAHLRRSPFHDAARVWFERTLSSEDVGIPLQCAMAFVRITTNKRIALSGLDVTSALGIVDGWLEQPNVRLLYASESHWPVLRRMLLEGSASGDIGTDAHLAALTIESGGTLYTTDSDFKRFPGLRWTNPLAGA